MKNKAYSDGLTYWQGGLLLGLLNVLLFFITGKPWGITAAITGWGASGSRLIGASPEQWLYFQRFFPLGDQFLLSGTILNLGVVIGALLSAVLSREFHIRRPRHKKQYLAAFLGGILMGYGARLAGGCSIGALVSGSASFSLHGWVFALFLLPGAWLGLHISRRLFY